MRKKKQVYTKEFKQEAVRLAQAGDRPAIEVAASLKVDPSLLSKWVRATQEDGPEAFRGHGKRTVVEEENWRLKSDVVCAQ
jgi:transposase-like protein